METQTKSIDRRAKRSVRLIKQAFIELMGEKGFHSVTIQDITDRADVNRGTFYAHFPDKYALADSIIRENFQNLLETSLPPDSGWSRSNLRLLIRTILLHFEDACRRCYRIEELDPLFERAVQETLAGLLMKWLGEVSSQEADWRVPTKAMSFMVSWMIFGAAVEWSMAKSMCTIDQMTDHILTLITEGVSRLTPGGLAE
ncbi:TetR/AcrR family transcriptional regulator [Paenibacillus hamazuiensis]|uniref:TetR/AcrR family transcriptional regulator n=1 Tax=Paenibacillus hamazuiensis TaxID=2936508 RepID=UPI0020102630|nr:TetR/AcrR family transcriptional regulator [Paenibacillus hamazuiensis]